MAQSLSKILLHLVFSTKDRRQSIPAELRGELHAYLAEACRALGCDAFRVGGTRDHVHIACSLPRTMSVAKLLEEIKKTSSAWMKARDPRCRDFAWQAGYGAFSLGHSQLKALKRYIDAQVEHHRSRAFRDELVELLQRYEIAYDESYLWD